MAEGEAGKDVGQVICGRGMVKYLTKMLLFQPSIDSVRDGEARIQSNKDGSSEVFV